MGFGYDYHAADAMRAELMKDLADNGGSSFFCGRYHAFFYLLNVIQDGQIAIV